MTSIARNLWTTVEISLVDIKSHLDHVSRRLFRFLFVGREILSVMTKRALFAKRRCHDIHDPAKLVGRHVIQDLDVLEFFAGGLDLSGLGINCPSIDKY